MFHRSLVLSFSSFALSAALLARDLQVMYRRRDAAWVPRSSYIILHHILTYYIDLYSAQET